MTKRYVDDNINKWFEENGVIVMKNKVTVILSIDSEPYLTDESKIPVVADISPASIGDVRLYNHSPLTEDGKRAFASRCGYGELQGFNAEVNGVTITGIKAVFRNKKFTKEDKLHVVSKSFIKIKNGLAHYNVGYISHLLLEVNTHTEDTIDDSLTYNIDVDNIEEVFESRKKTHLCPRYTKISRSRNKNK